MLHSSPVFALNKELTAQPSPICCLLAQSACTSSSGCNRTRRNPQGMLKDLKDLTTPVRSLRLPLHYWRPSAAPPPPPPPPPPGHHGSRSPPWVASAATIQVVLPTTLTTPQVSQEMDIALSWAGTFVEAFIVAKPPSFLTILAQYEWLLLVHCAIP